MFRSPLARPGTKQKRRRPAYTLRETVTNLKASQGDLPGEKSLSHISGAGGRPLVTLSRASTSQQKKPDLQSPDGSVVETQSQLLSQKAAVGDEGGGGDGDVLHLHLESDLYASQAHRRDGNHEKKLALLSLAHDLSQVTIC